MSVNLVASRPDLAGALAHWGTLGMGVRKAWRGRGTGKCLLEAALADAKAKGLRRIDLTVFDRNREAMALYLRQGFKVEGRMERMVRLDGIYRSAWLMPLLPD